MEEQELRFQVGEAWKGEYNGTTVYGNAAVVQDPDGLCIYRSLGSGNVGHALSDRKWWFLIIDLSIVTDKAQAIDILNRDIAQAEAARVQAEQGRVEEQQADHRQYGLDHAEHQQDHQQYGLDHQQQQSDHQQYGLDHQQQQSDHQQYGLDHQQALDDHAQYVVDEGKEAEREQSEVLRDQAESERAAAENDREAAEQERVDTFAGYEQRIETVEGKVTTLENTKLDMVTEEVFNSIFT